MMTYQPTNVPPVGLLEPAEDRRDSFGEDFGEVVKLSPEVTVSIIEMIDINCYHRPHIYQHLSYILPRRVGLVV